MEDVGVKSIADRTKDNKNKGFLKDIRNKRNPSRGITPITWMR